MIIERLDNLLRVEMKATSSERPLGSGLIYERHLWGVEDVTKKNIKPWRIFEGNLLFFDKRTM